MLASLWAAALFAVAGATPKTVVVGGGQCEDAELEQYVIAVAERLGGRLPDAVLDRRATADKLRPAPRVAAEEVERQLQAGLNNFYNLQLARAQELLESAMQQLQAFPPGDERARLTIDGWLLAVQLHREKGENRQADEAMRRILRVDPRYQLDPNYFSPSLRSDFEAERKRIVQGPKIKLSVRSSPAGADVFLDGVRVGRSPLHAEFAAGPYTLELTKGGLASLPRKVELRAPVQLQVDLDFEGAVRTLPGLCIAGADESVLLSRTVKLGAIVDAEQVVLVRVDRAAAGPRWVAAALVSVERGQKLREGGLKVAVGGAAVDEMKDLVEFLITGQVTQKVVVVADAGPPAPWSTPDERSLSGAEENAPVAARLAQAEARGEAAAPGAAVAWRQPALWGSAGTSAALLLGSGTVWLLSRGDAEELQGRLTSDGFLVQGDTRGQTLRRSLDARGVAVTAMLIGAAVTAGAAGALWWWPGGPPPVAAGIAPVEGGAAAFVGGEF